MSSSRTSDTRKTNSLNVWQTRLLIQNASKLKNLPNPEQTWESSELDASIRENFFDRFAEEGIFEKVKDTSEPGRKAIVWRTKPDVWKLLQHEWSNQNAKETNPCGHVGFRNLSNTDRYQCTHCDAEFIKSDAPHQLFDWPSDDT